MLCQNEFHNDFEEVIRQVKYPMQERSKKTKFDLAKWARPEIDSSESLLYFYQRYSNKKTQLALMENPFTLPENLKKEWIQRISAIDINRYPLLDQNNLTSRLHNFLELDSELDVLLGNGSNELIQMILHAFNRDGASILVPKPSYFLYKKISSQLNYKIIEVDLLENFELNLEEMAKKIEEKKPTLTFLSYPNNPTANCFNKEAIHTLIQKSEGLVVIDEAYYPYSEKTFINELLQYDNVLLLRSFSKFGMAAIRFGYAVGSKSIINYLRKLQVPFLLNTMTITTVDLMLDHFDLFHDQVTIVLEQRAKMKNELIARGAHVYPSDANLLIFKFDHINSNDLFEHCLENNVLICSLDSLHSLLRNCARVAIGSPQENERFLSVLDALLVECKVV